MHQSGLHHDGYKDHLRRTSRALQDEASKVNKRSTDSDINKIKKITRLMKKAKTMYNDYRYNLY